MVQEVLDGLEGYAVCANKNCHAQTVIGGSTEAVKAASEHLKSQGFDTLRLPVSNAFHTQVVAPATAALKQHLDTMSIQSPKTPILSNVTGDYYPETPEEIVTLLSEQVASPVEYTRQVERM